MSPLSPRSGLPGIQEEGGVCLRPGGSYRRRSRSAASHWLADPSAAPPKTHTHTLVVAVGVAYFNHWQQARHQAGIRNHLTSVASDTHRGYRSNISSLQTPPHTHQTRTVLNPAPPKKQHITGCCCKTGGQTTHTKNETNKKMLDTFEERKLVKTFKHVTSCFRCLNVQPEQKNRRNTADQMMKRRSSFIKAQTRGGGHAET